MQNLSVTESREVEFQILSTMSMSSPWSVACIWFMLGHNASVFPGCFGDSQQRGFLKKIASKGKSSRSPLSAAGKWIL